MERCVIRVMTWNIHGGVGPDGICDLSRVIALVERHDPDIVALQEIDSRRTEPDCAFTSIVSALAQHPAEARVVTAPDGGYGHAVISRWPMDGTLNHDISIDGREPRAAIETNIETPFGALHLVSAHLGLSFRERRQQAAKLAAMARSGSERSIVIGDFNDWISGGSVQAALAELMPGRTQHKTFPARLPMLALDRVYCRPASLLLRSWTDASASRVSDHLPVIAELDLGAGGSS